MSSTYGLPPWRPSLQKLPGAPSLRAGTACSGCALPARDSGGEAKAAGARRPPAPAPGRARASAGPDRLLPRPAGRACEDRGASQPAPWRAGGRTCGGRILSGGQLRAGTPALTPEAPAGNPRVWPGSRGVFFFFFWNSGCGPLTQQKRNESARAILTNKRVHSPLRRNLPFLIYVRFRSLLQTFLVFFLT